MARQIGGEGMRLGKELLKLRVFWIILGGILLLPIAVSSGHLYWILTITDIGLLAALLVVSRRRRNDGLHSSALSLMLAVMTIASWKHQWITNIIVFGICSVLFGGIAVSEMRSTRQGAGGPS
jgi:hypothetical protein